MNTRGARRATADSKRPTVVTGAALVGLRLPAGMMIGAKVGVKLGKAGTAGIAGIAGIDGGTGGTVGIDGTDGTVGTVGPVGALEVGGSGLAVGVVIAAPLSSFPVGMVSMLLGARPMLMMADAKAEYFVFCAKRL